MVKEASADQITLLSETDRFGTILFANEMFCEVSKYQRSELVGKPHNIIRHPDMPKHLFKCLWDTIQNGGVFRGVIKNKAKDGSPYWVNATIMPFTEHDGKVFKYVGVRYLLMDAEKAQQLFDEQMRSMTVSGA